MDVGVEIDEYFFSLFSGIDGISWKRYPTWNINQFNGLFLEYYLLQKYVRMVPNWIKIWRKCLILESKWT